jgi:hypothetical protein
MSSTTAVKKKPAAEKVSRPPRVPANPEADKPSDIVWGAGAIAKVLNLTERQAFHLLESGKLPAKKTGRWSASRAKLLESCGG